MAVRLRQCSNYVFCRSSDVADYWIITFDDIIMAWGQLQKHRMEYSLFWCFCSFDNKVFQKGQDNKIVKDQYTCYSSRIGDQSPNYNYHSVMWHHYVPFKAQDLLWHQHWLYSSMLKRGKELKKNTKLLLRLINI